VMELGRYAELVYGIEEVLDRTRRGRIAYSTMLGDLFLLALNEVRELCAATIKSNKINKKRSNELEAALKQVANASQEKVARAIGAVLDLLNPGLTGSKATATGSNDIQLFREFSRQLQTRSSCWEGRSARLVEMAVRMNRARNSMVDEEQLQAAVYLHDMGMAFLPLELLHNSDELSATERKRLHMHPQIAAVLLRQLGGWTEAAQMVEQHHERSDGSGYPHGLAGESICQGARIIAIIDTFESMTHDRPDREYRRSLLRAVAEINNAAGKQFDPEWVRVFRECVTTARV